MLLLSLSAGQKTGIAIVAAAFVVFALASSFLIPKYRPNYPGGAVKLFVLISALFAAGMLTAIVVLGKEKKEAVAASSSGPATTPSSTGGTTIAPPTGNPANGKALFASQGCGACHTFKPAGTNGKVGPDLDNLPADAQKANQPLSDYAKASIATPNAYVVPGFPSGVMPPFGQTLKPNQIDDLVAFLIQH